MHNVESAAMAVQNMTDKEHIMSIASIPAYMVYSSFNQHISTDLV